MSQRIFITGVTASLMKGLLDLFIRDGHQIIGLSRQDILLPGIEIIKGDLNEPSYWKDVLLSCDMIIHGAALTHSRDEEAYFKINLEGTKTLVDHCRREQGFVFISSRAAGPDSGAYGRSKWEAENYIMSHHEHHLILSPSEVFGAGKAEGIERLIHDALSKRFIPYPSGVQFPMRPIHVDDLCQQMYKHITTENWPNNPLIINGPESMSFPHFFELIAKASGYHPLFIPIPAIVMKASAHLAKWLPGLLPFSSDQVSRLYAPKSQVELKAEMISLEDYVKDLVSSSV